MNTIPNYLKKALLFLVVVLSFGIDAKAQKDMVVVIGQKMDGTAMSVPALHFDKSVFTFNFSGDKTNLCVSYRDLSKKGKSWKNYGRISYIDFKERRELWNKPINYKEDNAISTNKGVIVCKHSVNKHYNTFYSKINGRKLWENRGSIIRINESSKLFFGYRNLFSDQLCAFNMADGSELWSAEVCRKYGWSHQINISSSDKLVVADNLYRINFSTGETLKYPLRTGQSDTGGNLVISLAALAATAMSYMMASSLKSYYFYTSVS